jgi:hypothetical protein
MEMYKEKPNKYELIERHLEQNSEVKSYLSVISKILTESKIVLTTERSLLLV